MTTKDTERLNTALNYVEELTRYCRVNQIFNPLDLLMDKESRTQKLYRLSAQFEAELNDLVYKFLENRARIAGTTTKGI